ncbi:DUF2497 domain-containing protein [Parasphingopyxis marina]|uniref:DUF2497 domain-containing protein n=1 Tax=Parasphingopyxis marina TaxID=2761622 RepID=A0A842HVG6_9SPHN|nr:DUF2497 domain-containing protein [Parasphingopyxis marina]MBC2778018.1 DUF2497 domain-containing protein [Parasphingopyxis marina]
MGDVNHEPTMEEILASIKKIIAEDGDGPLSAPEARRTRARPELTPGPVSDPADIEDEAGDEDILELTDQMDTTDAEPKKPARAQPEIDEVAAPTEAIASEETVEASKAALAALSAIAAHPGTEGAAALDAHPLEGMVREMLKPMLKDWLDANLPAMVEEMVAREIARIAAGGK